MASNSYKIHDVEKNVFGRYRSIHTAKNDFEPYQWNASPWQKGAHLACHITTPMIDDKHTQTKNMCKYQYSYKYSHLKLQICRKTM